MRIQAFPTFIILFSSCAFSQGTWQALPGAPVTTNRIDDVSFVTSEVGWVAERGGSGRVWKTTDGGNSWVKQFEPGGACFRCIGFLDSSRGFVGLLGTEEFCTQTDTNIMYFTTNGGTSWSPVTNITGPKPKGLCGMHVVNDTLIYAVGRVRGPAFFMKSTDGGQSWTSTDLGFFAKGLVDIHFFTPDSGIAVGMTNSPNTNSSGVVLFTSDGGENWEPRYTTSQLGEWCWKISFPTRNVGYVSLQRDTGSTVNVLKTTDGGTTWSEPFFSMMTPGYYVQGIGFIDEMRGWMGGNSTYTTYQTTDGGDTWGPANFGVRVNRFQFLPSGIGYAVGQTVYKYTPAATSVKSGDGPPLSFSLSQNHPNPFNPSTVIGYDLPRQVFVSLEVYDLLGRKIKSLVDREVDAGHHTASFHAGHLPAGVYYYVLRAGEMTLVGKMMYLP